MTDPHAHFWSVIDKAYLSADALRPLLEAMSREELVELWRDYHMLSSELLQPPWVTRRTDFQEELTRWVVAQGKAYYDDVHAHPEKFPKEQGPQGRRFTGTIVSVYFERFDEETTSVTGSIRLATMLSGRGRRTSRRRRRLESVEDHRCAFTTG